MIDDVDYDRDQMEAKTMTRYKPLRFKSSLGIALAALLGACAGSQRVLSTAQEAELLGRAEARWRALERRDWGRAYEFTSPAYREVFTREMYARRFSYMVEWELTAVEFVNYDERVAVASVAARVMSKPVKQTSAASAAIGTVPSRFVEQWILSDGQWWYSANL